MSVLLLFYGSLKILTAHLVARFIVGNHLEQSVHILRMAHAVNSNDHTYEA